MTTAAERKQAKDAKRAANKAAHAAKTGGQTPAAQDQPRVVAVHFEGVRYVLWLVPLLLLLLAACTSDQVYVAAPTAAAVECPATEWRTSSEAGYVAMLPACLQTGRWGVVLTAAVDGEGPGVTIEVWPGAERDGTRLWTASQPLRMTAGLVGVLEVCEGCTIRPGWSRIGIVTPAEAVWALQVHQLP